MICTQRRSDKVRVYPNPKVFLLGLWLGGEICQLSMDNHLPLEQITFDFEQKRRWFDLANSQVKSTACKSSSLNVLP